MMNDSNYNSNREFYMFDARTEEEILEDELDDQLRKRQCDKAIESHTEFMTSKDPEYPELEAQEREMHYGVFKIYYPEQYRREELGERLKRGVTRTKTKGINKIKNIIAYLLLEFVLESEERHIELYEQIMPDITREVMEMPGLNELNNELDHLLLYFNQKVWPIERCEPIAKGM